MYQTCMAVELRDWLFGAARGGERRQTAPGALGRGEWPRTRTQPGRGRPCESATHRADMDWRASTVEDASIDSTVASEVREVRMREDPVGTSASQASCCGQGPGTHSARAAVQAHGAWPVWSLLSICTTGHQASTGLLLGRRASTRTHQDAPELSTKMHAGGPCQKPPPHSNARAPPSMSVWCPQVLKRLRVFNLER